MAYTSSDLNNLEAAIMALSTGRRRISVTIGGKQSRYSEVDLPELRKLRHEIKSELQSSSRNNFFLISTSKGL